MDTNLQCANCYNVENCWWKQQTFFLSFESWATGSFPWIQPCPHHWKPERYWWICQVNNKKLLRTRPQLMVIWSPGGEETDDKVEKRSLGMPFSSKHIAWEGQCLPHSSWKQTSTCQLVRQGERTRKPASEKHYHGRASNRYLGSWTFPSPSLFPGGG